MSTAELVTLVSLDSQQRETGIFRVWFIWPILATTPGWGKTLCLTSSLLTPTSTQLNHSRSKQWMLSRTAASPVRSVGCLLLEPDLLAGGDAQWGGCGAPECFCIKKPVSPWARLCRVLPLALPRQLISLQCVTSGPGAYSRLVGGHSPAAPRPRSLQAPHAPSFAKFGNSPKNRASPVSRVMGTSFGNSRYWVCNPEPFLSGPPRKPDVWKLFLLLKQTTQTCGHLFPCKLNIAKALRKHQTAASCATNLLALNSRPG